MSTEYSKLAKQSAHGSLALLIGQVLSSIILAVSTIIIASKIGSIQYGEYSKVLVPVGIAQLIQDPGITVALTRYVSLYQKENNVSKLSSTILTGIIFNLGTAIAISAALILFATPIASILLQQSELDGMIKISAFAIIGQALFSATNAIFIGYMRIRIQNITLIIYSVIKGLISSALVIIGFGLSGAIIGHVASSLIAGAMALTIVLISIRRENVTYPSMKVLRELLTFGLPIYVSRLIGGAFSQLTNSLMVIYVATDQIGNYSAALTFTILIGFLISPIQTTLYPLFSKLESGSAHLQHAYENAIKYSSLVAVAGSFALIGLARPLITTIYEDKYPTAVVYFAVYLLTYIPIGFGSSCQTNLLNSQNKTRATMWMNVISLIAGAMAAFILIPPFGILGLITSVIVSAYPAVAYGHFYIKKNLGVTFDAVSTIKIFISSLVSLIAVLFFQRVLPMRPIFELISGSVVFLIIYLAMLKITRTLNSSDYQIVRSMIENLGPFKKLLYKLLDFHERLAF